MYCPKCGQQRVAEQRFCSRCGFLLTGVTTLIAADGVLPAPEKERGRRSPRYDGMRQGAILLMLAVLFLPLVDIIPAPYHEALVFVLMLAGVMRIGYALIFQEGAGRQAAKDSELSDLSAATSEVGVPVAALPPAGSIPASDFINRREETAEAREPLSVTENTTRLLDEQ
jgi:hypothetical protein